MPVVRVESGALLGSEDSGICSFKGVPYAEPVGAAARWLPPVPRKPWSGMRDAVLDGPACAQFAARAGIALPGLRRKYFDAAGGNSFVREGDDCLLLDICTPSPERGARLPVMVYFHGGGFTGGGATFYPGRNFAARNVVYVAVQYRLGPPGFLHGSGLFDGDFCADNRAFLDQLQALKWVQENIAAFGGDAGNVTIFGESAGAFSVFQLCASPLGKGLFRRAIAMGGMPFTSAPAQDYHRLTADLLSAAGVKPGDKQALIAMDLPALRRLQGAITRTVFSRAAAERYGILGWSKVGFVGAAIGSGFLDASALTALRRGTPNNIDLLLGTCADDGQLFSLFLPFSRTLSARMFMNNLAGLAPGGDLAALIERYRALLPRLPRSQLYDKLNNDLFYRIPTIVAAEAHAAAHAGRTWHYELDLQSGIAGLRAIHGIDVGLLFGSECAASALLPAGDAAADVSKKMLDCWVSFATTGRPSAAGMPAWNAYDSATRTSMVFDRDTRSEQDRGSDLRRLWDGYRWERL
ncbi:MAG TPA: carboxylesterase family protein [Nevskiaceae bacterium]|nr:carboxylesterase family protein [Nevskiaceae bacterium]